MRCFQRKNTVQRFMTITICFVFICFFKSHCLEIIVIEKLNKPMSCNLYQKQPLFHTRFKSCQLTIMEQIQAFLTSTNFTIDKFHTYTEEDIISINRVINGDFTNVEQNKYALQYAGICVQQNMHLNVATKTALEYYELSFMNGHIGSSLNIANMHFKQKNYEKAIEYYKTYMENGGLCGIRLAICYFEMGDKINAINWVIEGCKKNNLNCMNWLFLKLNPSEYCDSEINASIDTSFAICYKMHEQGDVKKTHFIGNIFENMNQSDIAEKYYLQAHNSGHDDSCVKLYNIYKNQNRPKHLNKFLTEESNKKRGVATYLLGLQCYKNNEYENAEEYYLKALEQKYYLSAVALSVIYYNWKMNMLAKQYYEIAKINGCATVHALHTYCCGKSIVKFETTMNKKSLNFENDLMKRANEIDFDDIKTMLIKRCAKNEESKPDTITSIKTDLSRNFWNDLTNIFASATVQPTNVEMKPLLRKTDDPDCFNQSYDSI